jgi:hypothetical protein
MRTILFLLFAIPMTCYGIGPESCWLEGKVNGKTVTLGYWGYAKSKPFNPFYGLSGSPIYGYCVNGSKGGNVSHYLACASKPGGIQKVYYEQSPSDQDLYICKAGCNKGIVKEFRFKCEVGD